MKKIAVIVLFLFAGITAFAQQDAQYSQYMFNGLFINPAYAGYKQDIYLYSFYRSQWTGFTGAPQSFSASIDGSVNDTKVGLGLLVANDRIGAQSATSVYANYAYRLQMDEDGKSRLAFGVGAGFSQAGIDGSKLNPAQTGDADIPTGYQGAILPDARLGVLYTDNKFFIGASVDNLLSSWLAKNSVDKTISVPIPIPHFYFTTGFYMPLNDDIMLKPSIMLKDDRGGPTSLDLNTFVLLNEVIWVGGTYRTAVPLYKKPNLQNGLEKSNALVAMVQFFVNEKLRIGYSFDYSLTPLANYNYGSHEISIGLFLKEGKLKSINQKCYY
ncbi:MAG: type IX secretion system membrane protein PorP/SprF [Bacteroidetes bacterium]|jgi:type IX secretion system PorP/SprF family membrane protein|nr:type IX secretion system membrane protein PorP/SprF [Bacteroidota bacterium]